MQFWNVSTNGMRKNVVASWETYCLLILPSSQPRIHPMSQVWPAVFANSHLMAFFTSGSSPMWPELFSQTQMELLFKKTLNVPQNSRSLYPVSAFDTLKPDWLLLRHSLPCPSWEWTIPAAWLYSSYPGKIRENSTVPWNCLFVCLSLFLAIGSWNVQILILW